MHRNTSIIGKASDEKRAVMTRRSIVGTLFRFGVVVAFGSIGTSNIRSVRGFQSRPFSSVIINPYQYTPQVNRLVDKYPPTVTIAATKLYMGKLRNRQAELQKKMALAKKQNAMKEGEGSTNESEASRLTDDQVKEMNDRKRIDELLKSSQGLSVQQDSLDYLSQTQEEETIDAYRRGVDRLFEGDPAPTQVFEELVSIKSENAIGETGATRLLPWLRKNGGGGGKGYLIVVCDPRVKSPDFRDTVKAFRMEKEILSHAIFINADTPAENRRWLKKDKLMDSGIRLFSDEKREWMRTYTALGEQRWSMTLFILAEERVQKLVRELASVNAPLVVERAIKAMEKRRL